MSLPVLDRKLTLETPEQNPDGAGGFVTVWSVLGTLWGDIRPGSGRETKGPGAPLSRVGYKITVRAAPLGSSTRPRPGQRLREGARIFAIFAVTEANRQGRYLTLHAEEETVQ